MLFVRYFQMHRMKFCLSLVTLSVVICAGGQTCNPLSGLAQGLRKPPVIIPSGDGSQSLTMSFSVDLRDYPESNRISWEFGDGGVTPTMMVSAGQTISHQF